MKQRLLYIDVLRGIAILIVIYSHILLFCVGYSETSALTNLLRLYFLNGFFSYLVLWLTRLLLPAFWR